MVIKGILDPDDARDAVSFGAQGIVVSNHAGRALKAADALLAKGFKVAGAAGAQDYEAEGGKLTRIAAPAPKVATVAK